MQENCLVSFIRNSARDYISEAHFLSLAKIMPKGRLGDGLEEVLVEEWIRRASMFYKANIDIGEGRVPENLEQVMRAFNLSMKSLERQLRLDNKWKEAERVKELQNLELQEQVSCNGEVESIYRERLSEYGIRRRDMESFLRTQIKLYFKLEKVSNNFRSILLKENPFLRDSALLAFARLEHLPLDKPYSRGFEKLKSLLKPYQDSFEELKEYYNNEEVQGLLSTHERVSRIGPLSIKLELWQIVTDYMIREYKEKVLEQARRMIQDNFRRMLRAEPFRFYVLWMEDEAPGSVRYERKL